MEEKNKNEEKWVFIVNPVAGNGFAKEYMPVIIEKTKQYQVEADFVETEKKGHATEIARKYIEKGFKYIIGVGGDGTLNEITRALINKKDVVVGIIPAGTGNDFIQILGFPDRFNDEHWKIFFERNIILMDAGSCNGKTFINGMGLGFDAQVAAENYSGQDKVKKGGKNKYIWHIIKTILFYREKKMVVISNGESYETDCFINTVSVGRRFAGGFMLTPKAIANDGLFDVCNVKRLSVIERFKLLPTVPKGEHIKNKKVSYYQTDMINLEFKKDVPFHLDGELFFDSKFFITVLPEALNVIYNPSGNHYFNDITN